MDVTEKKLEELLEKQELDSFTDTDVGKVFARYFAIILRLRAPDGCPWDKAQTMHSLRRYLIEESFEVLAAIEQMQPSDRGSYNLIAEEIGDVFIVLLLIVTTFEDISGDSLSSILVESAHKLFRRHPHVFKNLTHIKTPKEVAENWRKIKRTQEKRSIRLTDIAKGFPPLEQAAKLQKEAVKQNIPLPHISKNAFLDLLEVLNTSPRHSTQEIEQHLGKLLFMSISLCRDFGLDPSVTLESYNRAFIHRSSKKAG